MHDTKDTYREPEESDYIQVRPNLGRPMELLDTDFKPKRI
jgi:hypothetical protein